jgi:regulatory protein
VSADDRPPQPSRTLQARAVGYLARRDYSRAELRAKLLSANAERLEAEEVDAVLDALAARGYLSDTRFASAVVRQKRGTLAKRALAATLKAKGVGDDEASAAISAAGIDDADALAALWRRRFGRIPADEREKARQVRFLQRRGFELSAILKLLRDPPA